MMLLTETEVAEKLRCSTSKIKRLRMSGELPYIVGRPVLIDETDLIAFIDARKRRAAPAQKPITKAEETNISADEARAWALKKVFGTPQRKRRTAK